MDLLLVLTGLVALAAGTLAGFYVLRPGRTMTEADFRKKADSLVEKSALESEKIKSEVAGRVIAAKTRSADEEIKISERLKRVEALLQVKEQNLQKRSDKLLELKKIIDEGMKMVGGLKAENDEAEKRFTEKLAEKTGQGIPQIKTQMINEFERDLVLEREDKMRKYEDTLNEEKERIAKNMVTDVIQRYSSPTSVEKKATSITVPRDEIKGRIIGKNAENIKLLEELTGVDVIFNDAPNTIIISCFDLVKKHVAREAISKLMKERAITPDKVRFKLKEAENETDRTLTRIGNEVIRKLELGNRKLPPELAKILGRLQFRTSYGQNILKHSLEVGNFTVMLGSELGLNIETCKIGGFFHDLGKAVDQEVGGSHDVLTKEIMEKFGFSEEEIHAAWTHHDSLPQRTPEALLVKAGDAISATRPGARQESIEKYLERIRALENISSSYEGVSKAYAISAGREVRVIVEPGRLKDEDLPHLAKNIATEIQENVGYPGKIKINVIRRTQSSDYANRIPGPTKKQLKK
jgi:ribonucrease Y